MSLLELFFPVVTVVLAAGCFVCYKTNKPLREKAAKEAAEAAEKKAREERDARERLRRDNRKVEMLSDLEDVLQNPERLRGYRYGSHERGIGYRWKALYELARFMAEHRRLKEHNADLESRVTAQGKKLRDLQGQMLELHRAMALNTGDF